MFKYSFLVSLFLFILCGSLYSQWQQITTPHTSNTGYKAVAFWDANLGWITGDKLIKTTDGGTTWTDIPPPHGTTYNAIFAISPTKLWMVGDYGRIVHSMLEGGDPNRAKNFDRAIHQHGIFDPLCGEIGAGYFLNPQNFRPTHIQ